MPRYKVVERRCYEVEYVVEADNEDDAKHLRGSAEIVEEDEGNDSWGDELLSCEEIDEDDEELT